MENKKNTHTYTHAKKRENKMREEKRKKIMPKHRQS